MIDFQTGRASIVLGTTRYGKTWGTVRSLEKSKTGVIFFNTALEQYFSDWIQADMTDDAKSIIAAANSGEKVAYNPSDEHIQQELEILIRNLFKDARAKNKPHDLYLVVDEVSLFQKATLREMQNASVRGLRWGINPIWLSQRPQQVDNDIMTMCTFWVMYRLQNENMDNFKRYGVPAADMQSRIRDKYQYVMYDGTKISEVYKV